MRFAFLLLVLLTSVAHADEPVRDDIVDLRHHRLPDRRVFLGWASDGRAVVHAVACGVNDAGGPFCSSSLEVIGNRKVESVRVLEPSCGDSCDPFGETFAWSVPTELASQAIRAERAALAKLGALQPSATGPLPQVSARSDGCNVDVVIGDRRVPKVLALGKGCIREGGSESLVAAVVVGVQLSPDRRRIAVALRVRSRFMEWSDWSGVTKVLDAAP